MIISRPFRRVATAALLLLMFSLSSCGDLKGGETVYLFVVNGYTAANTLSVYGPSGPIAQNLEFGERIGPIEFDRRLGGELRIIVEGTPEVMTTELEIFNFYPQETGTLFIKRRNETAEISFSLYRHTQTVSGGLCTLTMENGLSVGPTYLTSSSFSFAAEFNVTPDEAFYLEEANIPVSTECGPLPTPTRSPIPRDDLRTQIEAEPWFFLSDCNDEVFPRMLCHYWGILDEQDVVAYPPTPEYYECIQGAITIKPPEDAVPSPFPAADSQVTCPPGELTWEDVQVDPTAVADCKLLRRYSAKLLNPTAGDVSQTWSYITNANNGECQHLFRLRTSGLDVIFGPTQDDCDNEKCEGSHLNGSLVVSDVTIPAGSEHFYVLFGRPVNPLIWQWNSGQNFVDLAEFPYFNGQIKRINQHDDAGEGNPAP